MLIHRSPTLAERQEFLGLILAQLGEDSARAFAYLGITAQQFERAYMSIGEVRVLDNSCVMRVRLNREAR